MLISHDLVCKNEAIMVVFFVVFLNGEVYLSKWLVYKSKL